jgi:hypothetical protein
MQISMSSIDTLARWIFVPFVATALLLASPGGGSAATLVDIATDATDPSNLGDTEPSIAVNPLNPLEIAVVTFSEGWGPTQMAPVWKSNDGGMTWRKVFQLPQPVAGSTGPGDQKIAFDSAGRLFVAELGSGLSPPRCFVFRQTGAADAPLTPGMVYCDDQPHLDVDRAPAGSCFNRLYSPWLDFSVIPERSMDSSSTDSGVTMVNVPVYPPRPFPNRTTRIALAPDGRAYVVYKTREGAVGGDFENAHFRVNRSDNCGVAWDALGADGVSIHGAAAVQTFFTTQFGNPAKGKVARARSSDAWIAVDPGDGDVYAAYVSKDGSGFGQIYVARSTDQGTTWVSTRVTDGTHHSAYPEVAVTNNGTVGVLYIDFDDSGPTTIFRHRFARSSDDGTTWTDEILQSMDPGPLANASSGFLWGDYEGLTAHGNTFYGVFTGQSIGRTTLQLDPIFFKVEAEKALALQYSVKFVCGKSAGEVVAPGAYFTAINVHNPTDTQIGFRKKVAIALPSEKPGPVSKFFDARLGPDQALEIDCRDIFAHIQSTADFLKGFVVIESDVELDVVAVYTAGGATGHVETLHSERVSPRRREVGKADLVPVPDPQPGVGFCKRDNQGRLVVTVKNQGTVDAPASTTTVDFVPGGSFPLSTPAIPAGGSVDLTPLSIPAACFNPDCDFRITVDSNNQINESNEGNNNASGTCIG